MSIFKRLAFGLVVISSAALGVTALSAPAATAGVSVGVNIGVPGPGYYGEYTIRTGRCARPAFAFNHPHLCGYPRYTQPVFIDGVWVREPVYYRTYRGSRYFGIADVGASDTGIGTVATGTDHNTFVLIRRSGPKGPLLSLHNR